MDCDKANLYMMHYIDKDFTDKHARQLNLHLKECESCRQEFLLYEMMTVEFDKLSSEHLIETPFSFEAEVMTKIRAITPQYRKLPSTNDLFGIICGIFSVLFGCGAILAMNRDALMDYFMARESTAAVITFFSPLTEYINEAITQGLEVIGNVTAAGAVVLDASRGFLLAGVVILAIFQYILYTRNNKVEI